MPAALGGHIVTVTLPPSASEPSNRWFVGQAGMWWAGTQVAPAATFAHIMDVRPSACMQSSAQPAPAHQAALAVARHRQPKVSNATGGHGRGGAGVALAAAAAAAGRGGGAGGAGEVDVVGFDVQVHDAVGVQERQALQKQAGGRREAATGRSVSERQRSCTQAGCAAVNKCTHSMQLPPLAPAPSGTPCSTAARWACSGRGCRPAAHAGPGCRRRRNPFGCKSGLPPATRAAGSAQPTVGERKGGGGAAAGGCAAATVRGPAQHAPRMRKRTTQPAVQLDQLCKRTTMFGCGGSAATARISRIARSRCSLERKRRRERLTAYTCPEARWRTRKTCGACGAGRLGLALSRALREHGWRLCERAGARPLPP